MNMKKYMHRWFIFDFDGSVRRAKCIDIEFDGGLGPLFLFETSFGNRFWLTKKEMKWHESSN